MTARRRKKSRAPLVISVCILVMLLVLVLFFVKVLGELLGW